MGTSGLEFKQVSTWHDTVVNFSNVGILGPVENAFKAAKMLRSSTNKTPGCSIIFQYCLLHLLVHQIIYSNETSTMIAVYLGL